MKIQRKFCALAAFFGLLSVALGALGAHALETQISPKALSSFETAVRYQAWHALALLFISLAADKLKYATAVGILFAGGIVLFSGSIYLLSLRAIWPWVPSWLGPVTPLGGMLFMAGWALLLMDSLRKESPKRKI